MSVGPVLVRKIEISDSVIQGKKTPPPTHPLHKVKNHPVKFGMLGVGVWVLLCVEGGFTNCFLVIWKSLEKQQFFVGNHQKSYQNAPF